MKLRWHSGPPPHVGWWPASMSNWEQILRYWDGEVWSEPCHCTHDRKTAGRIGKRPEKMKKKIYWAFPWWKWRDHATE